MERILVWDWPVRLGHWLMVAAFAMAWLTAESESWRRVHAAAGGVVVGVILFRLVWGVVGTRHARFASFLRGPAAVLAYLEGLAQWHAPHATGHNPAGGWAIMALLALGLATGFTGWLAYNDIGSLGNLHEGMDHTMLAVVGLHIAGVGVGSLAHRENLVRAMLTGYKRGTVAEAITSPRLWAVPLLFAAALACGMGLAR
jgi:cytochrome b